MKQKAIYPGTFDPFTNGHLDVLERALNIFEEVIVVIAANSHKQALFSGEERLSMIREVIADYSTVSVEMLHDGLLADYARQVGARAIVRGVRQVKDFEYEFQMSLLNRQLYPEVTTVFLRFMLKHPEVKCCKNISHTKRTACVARIGLDKHSDNIPPDLTGHLIEFIKCGKPKKLAFFFRRINF